MTLFQRAAISAGEREPFSTPHTVTVLLVSIALLIYALSGHDTETSIVTNTKHGLSAAILVGVVFCAEHLRDTLFVRPHPAIWRAATGCGLFYCMACAFALFQRIDDVRLWMQVLDPVYATGPNGVALPETSYGENCELTVSNVRSQMDIFVLAHLIGWIFKAAMIRDFGLSMLLSLLFELMEYTFEYLQPNFAECWWDHWVLDFLICNTGGILICHWLMAYFNSRQYSWAGTGPEGAPPRPPRVGLRRVLAQFRPAGTLERYEWRVLSSLKRLLYVLGMVVVVMVSELDAFFLKFILRVQPPSLLNLYRLILWWAVGMVALRDYYAFMTDSRIKRLGATCWISLAMGLLELLVVIKFGMQIPEWNAKRPPAAVVWAWGATGAIALVLALWWYGYKLPRRAPPMASEPEEQLTPPAAEVEAALRPASAPASTERSASALRRRAPRLSRAAK